MNKDDYFKEGIKFAEKTSWDSNMKIKLPSDNGDNYDSYLKMQANKSLTPQEWWSLAPWNYDMDSAPKNTNQSAKWEDKTHILLKDKNNNIQVSYWALCDDYELGGYWYDVNFNPIAWIPLPEQK